MRRGLCIAAYLLALTRGLQAQSVQGQVVERGSNDPIASGVIILFDEPGNEVARAQTRTEWEPYVPTRVTDVIRRMMGFLPPVSRATNARAVRPQPV